MRSRALTWSKPTNATVIGGMRKIKRRSPLVAMTKFGQFLPLGGDEAEVIREAGD
jgi:hypothetical protein